MQSNGSSQRLILEDGMAVEGSAFGHPESTQGEVVFNTGMVGYTEALTDPSYKGQILVLTTPLVGNYGVPRDESPDLLQSAFESQRIHIRGLVVSDYSFDFSHWEGAQTLDAWLRKHRVPALSGIDTRRLTKHIRQRGSMLGRIEVSIREDLLIDPNGEDLVSTVTVPQPIFYQGGRPKVILIDCGCKHGIVRHLLMRGATVLRVPYDYDFLEEDFHAVLISNGPGDPKQCRTTVAHLQTAMKRDVPIFGICLGNQLLALAAGADTFKLKFGHRGHNQPCLDLKTGRCYITSQNHGYAVKNETLPGGWEPWFVNANDGTNEGIRHVSKPFMGVQFHPEACPGPLDTTHLFDEFLQLV